MVEASIRGEGCRLVLRVERYAYPEETAGSDANWLDGEVELTVATGGSYRARERVSLVTDELERFRDQLRSLDADLEGEATLEHLEEQMGLTVRLEAGRGTLAGVVRQPVGAELRFHDVEIDQTSVREALRELDGLVRAFPVRGPRQEL